MPIFESSFRAAEILLVDDAHSVPACESLTVAEKIRRKEKR
jgi:hypothetical protein